MSGVSAALLAEGAGSITEQVLASIGLEPLGAPAPSTADGAGDLLTASVGVSGSWNGHVTVSCSPETARSITAMMLGIDEVEVAASDVADAVGELGNMVGGGLKSMVPPPSTLSLPRVVRGPRGSARGPGGRLVVTRTHATRSGPLTVDLWTSSLEGCTP